MTTAKKISLEKISDIARGLGCVVVTSVQPIKLEDKIRRDIDHLVDMDPGEVWTEYHWRAMLQLKQDFEKLMGEKNVD